MTRLNCLDVEQELWRYIDRELPAPDVAAVSDHLRVCEGCRKLYHQWAREANVCRRMLSTAAMGRESSERFIQAMRREGLFRREERSAGVVGSFVRPAFRIRGALALAAVCLIVATVGLGSWFLGARAPSLLGEFETHGRGDGVVLRADGPGAPLAGFTSGRILSGNVFVVPAEVELVLRVSGAGESFGATLTVPGPSELSLDSVSTPRSFSAVLKKGLLKASVEPRRVTGEPFVIRTPEAFVSVVGTEFVVDVTREGVTRLDVSRGAVDFRALSSPVGRPAERVTPSTGARIVRRGDLAPTVPETDLGDSPPSTASATASAGHRAPASETGSGGSTPEASEQIQQGDVTPSDVPVSPDGPTLQRRAPPDLDQVVNPRNE